MFKWKRLKIRLKDTFLFKGGIFFFFFFWIFKIFDDRKRKFLKEDPRGSIIIMRVFRGSCTLPDSSPLIREINGPVWMGYTFFSTHASLEFFSFGSSIQKVSFSVVQSSLHDLRSRLYSNNLSWIRTSVEDIKYEFWSENDDDDLSTWLFYRDHLHRLWLTIKKTSNELIQFGRSI